MGWSFRKGTGHLQILTGLWCIRESKCVLEGTTGLPLDQWVESTEKFLFSKKNFISVRTISRWTGLFHRTVITMSLERSEVS